MSIATFGDHRHMHVESEIMKKKLGSKRKSTYRYVYVKISWTMMLVSSPPCTYNLVYFSSIQVHFFLFFFVATTGSMSKALRGYAQDSVRIRQIILYSSYQPWMDPRVKRTSRDTPSLYKVCVLN